MTRFSLQRRLLLLLVGSALLVWVAMLVAGHDKARAEINELADVRLQQLAQRGEPALPVGIGQGDALAHLGAAGGAVVVVALNQGQAKGLGQRQTQA